MIYGSVCSGIEAATQAWHPLGWTPAFFSEIEKFPSAVLAHHYGSNMPGEEPTSNGVPNLGDMTKFEEWPDYAIDLLVGGTPCQDYSVAGLRAGMDGIRGSLTLTYAAIARRYRPRWLAWENVPGVFSLNGGRDFASFLGLLAGRRIEVPRDGWGNAGVVPGYHRAYGIAWRVLDAQYIRVDGFGRAVPQRRRRVFVVGYLGDWRRAAAVLLERESMCGDSPPRREAGKDVAPTISARPTGGGGLGTDFDLDGGLIEAFGGNNTSGPVDVATSLQAHAGPKGRLDFASETFLAVAPTLDASYGRLYGQDNQHIDDGAGLFVRTVAKTLTRGAESAGKGGYAGRRQEDDDNLVAYPLTAGMAASAARMPHEQGALIPFDTTQISSKANRSLPKKGDPCHPLASGAHAPAIAIQERAVCENIEAGPQGSGFSDEGAAYTLEARHHVQAVQSGWAVRRLTPTECHRLQGFKDGFCNIPWRGKEESPDGPQYKALGNSMAVNVMRWIGQRIAAVEEIVKEAA